MSVDLNTLAAEEEFLRVLTKFFNYMSAKLVWFDFNVFQFLTKVKNVPNSRNMIEKIETMEPEIELYPQLEVERPNCHN